MSLDIWFELLIYCSESYYVETHAVIFFQYLVIFAIYIY